MVERFAASARRFDKHAQIAHHLVLTGKVVETLRAQRPFEFLVGAGADSLGAYVVIFCHIHRKFSKKKRLSTPDT